ncbi:MAG: putative maltokinase, partial [Alphaproteobacteria bacterium]|nr:putative maltokinase [Alphaproteobacteria bacterium]
SPDRNAGFSRADPAALYLPALMDPVYGYQSVNVEAQSRNQSSLLNWMRRLIAVRQGLKAFGRGSLAFLYPVNRAIFAYLRQYEGETILCVANLSRSPQAFSLDLREFRGCVPLELSGRTRFPAVGDAPYELSLQGHSFYWFALHAGMAPAEVAPPAERAPDFVTLVCSDSGPDVFRGRNMAVLLQHALPAYMPRQRWFRAKDRELGGVAMAAAVALDGDKASWLVTVLEARFKDSNERQRYLLPMALEWREVRLQPPQVQPLVIAKTRRAAREGTLFDATGDDRFLAAVVDHLRRGATVEGEGVRLRFEATSALESVPATEPVAIARIGAEQSNSTVIVNDSIVLKLIRVLEPGRHPEIEYGRYLTEQAQYRNTPPLLGSVEIVPADGKPMALAVAHGFVRNQGDGWSFTLKYLNRVLEELAVVEGDAPAEPAATHAVYLAQMRQLGLRVAELHKALCPAQPDGAPADERFAAEPVAPADLQRWSRQMRDEARSAIAAVRKARARLTEAARQLADRLVAGREAVLGGLDASLAGIGPLVKTRIHGDLHLGQVLVAQNDFYVIDFEGEPRRSLAERQRKESPLRDIAGMIRSFDYAASAALGQMAATQPERQKELRAHALAWRGLATEAFLSSYRETIAGCPSYPAEPAAAARLLALFLLGKVFYEIRYELANRPNWVEIPLKGAIELLPAITEGAVA